MLGGPKTEIEAASSILEFMGAKIFPCGDVGTGQVAKVFLLKLKNKNQLFMTDLQQYDVGYFNGRHFGDIELGH